MFLTCRHQLGLHYRFVFFVRGYYERDLTDRCASRCRCPAWRVSRLAAALGTRWCMVWLGHQFGVFLLGSRDRVVEDQLEERRG